MSLGLAFWVIMIVWLIFGAALHLGYIAGAYGGGINILLLFVLFTLLGWQVFGAPLHKG